jgi:hypothetical protein
MMPIGKQPHLATNADCRMRNGSGFLAGPVGLLVEVRVVGMVMMMVMVMRVFDHHNLRRCHGGRCDAEEKSEAEPEFFHTLL